MQRFDMSRLARVGSTVLVLAACIGWVCGPADAAPASDAPSIVFVSQDDAQVIAIRDLPESLLRALENKNPSQSEWQKLYPVRAVPMDDEPFDDQPNVLGRYAVRDGAVVFAPTYPISSRVVYRVEFRPAWIGGEGELIRAKLILIPAKASSPTQVARAYPSSKTVPANLLKFYIEFTQPMSRGVGYEYVRLERSDGSIVIDPFPEIGVELWDAHQQRFTVLLDPGRIKRGLKINEEMGLALVPGGAYRLVVDEAWPDAEGNPLAKGFEMAFKVTEPDHNSPNPETWRVDIPKAGSHDPLTIRFPETMDSALSERLIWLVDAEANEVAGRVTFEKGETRWLMTPEAAWRAGAYVLRIHPRLEDLAGNQIRRPFEIDVSEAAVEAVDSVVDVAVVIR